MFKTPPGLPARPTSKPVSLDRPASWGIMVPRPEQLEFGVRPEAPLVSRSQERRARLGAGKGVVLERVRTDLSRRRWATAR